MDCKLAGKVLDSSSGGWLSFREQLAESILHDGSTGCRVVEKFLKILQVVVQEPGQVFKPFLPSIISLSMEQVYPIVAEVRATRGSGWLRCRSL